VGAARSRTTAQGLTFDAGALIALDRGDRRIIALIREALAEHVEVRVPAGVVGQAWRNGSRQATLSRFLKAREVHIVGLDEHVARACGELCAAAGTADVIDASVVIAARASGDIVLTSDPDDLTKLDGGLKVERV
jgi:hypothetical protein